MTSPELSSVALPTGTVTFVFTDIEGSTRLVLELGDEAYGEVLATERRLIAAATEAHGGVMFGSEGDAHFLAFGSAANAIRAAVAAQRALAAHPWAPRPLRVRMGVHTGEARVVGHDYLGFEVHRAARVASAAHGGQVIASDAARALVTGGLPEDVSLRDLGEHRLKDLAQPERLWQVVVPDLQSTFAPLRTIDLTPNNLPPQLTSFVGRAEVAAGLQLLAGTRLLTLTGPGGTGKTRLSLALAAEALADHPGGAWFVPLASVTDPDLVASSIATAVGLLAATRTPMERILEHFADRVALLVLDNFEQVVGAAPVVAEILRGAPRLRIIVSSRAPLRISGEQEFPVPPLSLPAAGTTDRETLLASEAVRLFVERAMAVRPDFALTDESGPAVGEIVRRLDGLPLAIELAAARTRILSPAAMVGRLSDRLGLLSTGGRDLPERQRTLRGAIEWSHDLLGEPERRLFARLGVFAGGATLETAEAVCASDVEGTRDVDVLASLETLAEQNLVRIEADSHGDPRFAMLETIREYALERLAAEGPAVGAAFRDRHASAYLALAEAAASGMQGAGRGPTLDRLEDDNDNLRAALAAAIEAGSCERAARFLAALFRFWHMRGHLVEGRARARDVLAMPSWTDAPSRTRLHALGIAGGLAYWAGDLVDASARYAEAEVEARRLGDDAELANALYNRAFVPRPPADLEHWTTMIANESRPYAEGALELFRRLGDEGGAGRCLWILGMSDMYARKPGGTDEMTDALAIFDRTGDAFGGAWAHFTRGVARLADRDFPGTGRDFADALTAFRVAGDVSGVTLVLAALSGALMALGRIPEAFRMGGASSRWTSETGTHLAAIVPAEWAQAPTLPAPDPELDAAWRDGRQLSREAGVELATRLADEIAGPV